MNMDLPLLITLLITIVLLVKIRSVNIERKTLHHHHNYLNHHQFNHHQLNHHQLNHHQSTTTWTMLTTWCHRVCPATAWRSARPKEAAGRPQRPASMAQRCQGWRLQVWRRPWNLRSWANGGFSAGFGHVFGWFHTFSRSFMVKVIFCGDFF